MYFDNRSKLAECLTKGNLAELAEEFVKAKLETPEVIQGSYLAADRMYGAICNAFVEQEQEVPEDVSKHAVQLFTEAWEVKALQRIGSREGRFGALDENAIRVLRAYERFKALAIDVLELKGHDEDFSVVIADTEDGPVRVSYRHENGRLSLFRKDKEFVIFYGEDLF